MCCAVWRRWSSATSLGHSQHVDTPPAPPLTMAMCRLHMKRQSAPPATAISALCALLSPASTLRAARCSRHLGLLPWRNECKCCVRVKLKSLHFPFYQPFCALMGEVGAGWGSGRSAQRRGTEARPPSLPLSPPYPTHPLHSSTPPPRTIHKAMLEGAAALAPEWCSHAGDQGTQAAPSMGRSRPSPHPAACAQLPAATGSWVGRRGLKKRLLPLPRASGMGRGRSGAWRGWWSGGRGGTVMYGLSFLCAF